MDDLWYKNAIIYALDVRTFCDSDGDGIGDFPGLTSRLDYLSDLGVTCLWMLPFYPTPYRDNGYDVENYYAVDPRVGTLEDFETFLRTAGELGIRVLLDLIMNHTSDQHPWFQAARRDVRSRFRDYYVWTQNPPPIRDDQKNIFPDEEKSVWTYDERASAYFYHRFYHFQPDLHVANPDVQDEIRRVIDFWLSFPIAGFRIDAASHLVEAKGLPESAPDDPHGVLKQLHDFAVQRRPGTALIGEADVPLSDVAGFFGNGDQLNLIFNFLLDNDLFLALATEQAEPVIRCLKELPKIPERGQWANFLRNLDELDLERLSDDERNQVYEAFAPEEDMRIFGRGIRRRLAPMLGGDRRRIEMALSLLFSMPGTPVLVYGDEIGMGDDLSQPGRNAVRSPMQWSDSRNAGYSTAAEKSLIRPVIKKGSFANSRVNVAAQQADPDSLLNWVKQLVRTRREWNEFGWGNYHLIETDHPAVIVHLCDWKGSRVIAVHNLSGKKCTATVDFGGGVASELVRRLGQATIEPLNGKHRIRLDPYGYGWFRSASIH